MFLCRWEFRKEELGNRKGYYKKYLGVEGMFIILNVIKVFRVEI